jgi:amphiphysin
VQLEQDFEIASNDYENVNAAMKQDLPRFMTLATRFIDPLFHSFYYMQYVVNTLIPSHLRRCFLVGSTYFT